MELMDDHNDDQVQLQKSTSNIEFDGSRHGSFSSSSFNNSASASVSASASSDEMTTNQPNSSSSIYLTKINSGSSLDDRQYTVPEILRIFTKQDDGEIDIRKSLHSLSIDLDPSVTKSLESKLNMNDKEHDQLQLEFITVVAIAKITDETNLLLSSSPLNEIGFHQVVEQSIATVKLFKYHFQLSQTHSNFGFKNFGVILSSERFNLIKPFLNVLLIAPRYDFPDLEKLKSLFSLLVSFHLMNKYLFDSMLSTIQYPDFRDMLTCIFNDNNITDTDEDYSDGLYSLFRRYNDCQLLDQSTLEGDKSSDKLLQLVLPANFDYVLMNSVDSLLQLENSFANLYINNNIVEELTNITLRYMKDDLNREMIFLYCFNNPNTLQKLHQLANDKSNQDLCTITMKLSCYLLAKISELIIMNLSITCINDEKLLKILLQTNNQYFKDFFGFTDNCSSYSVTQSTISVLFEVVDQNLKLDLFKEKTLLQYLSVCLMNLRYNLNSTEDILSIHSLLNDMGSRLSFHALLETIQFILLSNLNKGNVSLYENYKEIPQYLQNSFGFDMIPPVSRFNFGFEDNLNHGGDYCSQKLRSETIGLFSTIEKSDEFCKPLCNKLMKDCLISCLIIKSKVYNDSREYNDEIGIMKFSTAEHPNDIITNNSNNNNKSKNFKLSMFRSYHGLDFKILTKSLELNLSATFSSLIVKSNYDNFHNNDDTPISNLIYHYQLDSLMSYILIYKEFGLFTLMKFIKSFILKDSRMIHICAKLLSDLLVFDPNLEKPSKLEYVSQIVRNGGVLSSLIRQFIELFDDGYSNSFKKLANFLKSCPSPIKPSKIPRGVAVLDYKQFMSFIDN
ncbi:hypothetical protein CANARDRAFT_10456 [[Candida] arabinofermentans NRRL YB-2248]|uniref:Uncharacterized protein n=1 Tax=[Candida] arabinofermentans NRRL YB-2248 TaxID=983967 RepID=A0A1E4ST19_9ASCO|nr:hypothetical protein CANARDRAFT_10456 [[Candida] arabinofermentans NRRL YB-2248]